MQSSRHAPSKPSPSAADFVPPAANDAAEPFSPLAAAEAVSLNDFGRCLDYFSEDDRALIADAYQFGARAHAGQTRYTGEPYITHPLAVACTVAEWQLDLQAVIAAILHDVLEDSSVTKAEIAERYGKTVAELVDGLSKLDKLEFQTVQDAQAENFRKMLLAMSRDLRVILIKLADRLHNMQTLSAMPPEKRRRIALETLDIYAPIAYRLGLSRVCRELENLCFAAMHPMRYRVLARAVMAARGNRRALLTRIHDGIEAQLAQAGLDAIVQGREKSTYSIYRKMVEKHLSFSKVLDIYGFRVIVPDTTACYIALGALHALYQPIPGKFKDYVAIPKANGYQSLHTTLIGPNGMPVEVQIRTTEMNQVAHEGVASHWLYKTSGEAASALKAKTHLWLQSLLELQAGAGDSREFLEHVKVDLFPKEVYVLTPKGQIMTLPRGATAIDFAYAVHTDVGHRCIAARINHHLVPLRTELANGDQVEIITAAHASPNPAWLKFAATGRARSRIRHFLKQRQQHDAERLGERFLGQALHTFGFGLSDIDKAIWQKLLKETTYDKVGDLLSDIGLGKRNPGLEAQRLLNLAHLDVTQAQPQKSLTVTGDEGAAVQIAACCHPIPGDPILGMLNHGQGVTVHLHDCPELRRKRSHRERWVDVEWDPAADRLFDVRLRVEVRNSRGVLASVATAIADSGSNIENVGMDEARPGVYTALLFTLQVSHRKHLAQVMRHLRALPEVVRITREKGLPR